MYIIIIVVAAVAKIWPQIYSYCMEFIKFIIVMNDAKLRGKQSEQNQEDGIQTIPTTIPVVKAIWNLCKFKAMLAQKPSALINSFAPYR